MHSNLIQVALLYSILKECRGQAEANRTHCALMTEIQACLEVTFTITKEQRMNIRLLIGQLILDPNRVVYMKLHLDVEDKIREKQTEFRFINVFGNLSRQRILSAHIKRLCSSVRNAFREQLRDSVTNKDKLLPLEDCTCNLVNRFSPLSRMTLGRAGLAHIAILRRFAYEHPELLGRQYAEYEGPDPDNEIEGEPQDLFDRDEVSSVTTSTSGGSRPHKRRCTEQSEPRPTPSPSPAPASQKGQDFWSMVDKWFFAHMQPDQYGNSWTSPGWSKYIEESIKLDHTKFKPVPQVNPFLEDFTDQGAHADAGESSGVGQLSGLAGLVGHL